MTLYNYFSRSSSNSSTSPDIPDPNGPLSEKLPSSKISSINKEVSDAVKADRTKTRAPYIKLTQKEKAEIGKNADEHGVASTLRKFVKKHPELKESLVDVGEMDTRRSSRSVLDH